MMLLHKIGLGAAVLTALLVGIAIAGNANDAPKKASVTVPGATIVSAAATPVAAPVPAEKEPAWKAEFRKAYGLKDGELVRRVAPPYPVCRAEHFLERLRGAAQRAKRDLTQEELDEDRSNVFTVFNWKDDWATAGWQTRCAGAEEGVRLELALEFILDFPRTRIRSDAATLDLSVTGDFVVRAGADREKVVAALEKILRKECGLNVSLAVEEVEQDVYVLSGKYAAKPLPDRKKDLIEIYGAELRDRTTGGGGSGSLQEMADRVEGFIESRITIGEIQDAPKRVEWHFNSRSLVTAQERAQDTDAESVMKNISAQTGLTAKLEKRKIKVLVVKKTP